MASALPQVQRYRQRKLSLTHSNRCIFSLPGIATQSICADLSGILKEILVYGIGGLFTPLKYLTYAFIWIKLVQPIATGCYELLFTFWLII